MSVSVGIDLGTTFSAVAYIDPKTQTPKIIPNREGKNLTPSVIQFIDGEEIFGSEAEDAFNAGEKNCVTTFKRSMGDDIPYCTIDGNDYTSEMLSSMLLRHLKEDAEAWLGDKIKDAVITVPAYFYSKEREATLRAAENAGLKVKKIIDEPNAAAMSYGLNHWRENAVILVYDLGGGTFDVTLVCMKSNGELSTITTKGNHQLGGRDWDNRIENLLVEKFEHETDLSIRDDEQLLAILKGKSEYVKKQLTSIPTVVSVDEMFPGYGKATVSITRKEFENNTLDLLDRTGDLCKAVLEEAKLSSKDITDILLVGGSTRMPQVSEYLKRLFNKVPLRNINPDEAVALGAAIQSSKLNESYATLSVREEGGKKVTDRSKFGLTKQGTVKPEKKLGSLSMLSVRETTAHAMGVVAINDEKKCYYNETIIPKNHPRPVRAAKRFRFYTTPYANNELAIYVLQGDSENLFECQIPYKYVVTGIRHVDGGDKVGIEMRVQYSYDENGIIKVQARQEMSNTDLPIHKENVSDTSWIGNTVDINKKNIISGSKVKGSEQSLAHKYKAITFSNVEWIKYDNIVSHPSGAEFNEPLIHVIANKKNIEFHGYNISEMNEGVCYQISHNDDFEIECNIDTSTISPHPGGYLEIALGLVSAQLTENGGNILLDGSVIATVAPRFHLKMSLVQGRKYEVAVDRKVVGRQDKVSSGNIDVRFGFVHGSHYCKLLSHAYVSDISMKQSKNQELDDSSDTDTWDD